MKKPLEFYEEKHGKDTPFLNKEAVIILMNEYADYRHDYHLNRVAELKEQQWYQEIRDRKNRPESPKP